MNKQTVKIVVGVLVVAGAAFYGGVTFGKAHAGSAATFAARAGTFPSAGFAGGRSGGTRAAGGGFVGGEVLSVDAQSVTVKLPSGGSETIYYSDTTDVLKAVTGTSADLSVGEQVTATGSSNSDGSITATSIQIRGATKASDSTGTATTDATPSATK